MIDLLQTGKAGLLSNQHYLSTTSNNISNVNTVGYVRQETLYYTGVVDWGIGDSYTRRVYDSYVQREMFRDQANVGFYETYSSGMSNVDSMLSDESMSISTSLNNYFSSLQDAVQNPTSTASRQEVLANLNNMVNRFNSLNSNIQNEINDINSKVDDTVSTINSLVNGIFDINCQIKNLGGDTQSDKALQMFDKRDQLINELSNYVDINVTTESDGSLSIYLGNGQLLANGDTYATLICGKDQFDSNKQLITVQFNDRNKTVVNYNNDDWGGQLGGYLQSSKELRQTMRDLGQLAVAFADAMNVQNKSGITLENRAGSELLSFTNPVAAISTNSNFTMDCNFIEGSGEKVTANDFQVVIGNGGDVTVYKVENEELVDITDEVTINNGAPLNIVLDDYGLSFSFNTTAGNMVGTKFYVQPTINQAFNLKSEINKPEDFAFASAVRTSTKTGNAGNAVINLIGMTSTGPDNGVEIDPTTHLPAFTANAPVQVVIDQNGNYAIFNANGDQVGIAPASCNGQKIFTNAVWDNAYLPADYDPGYDIEIIGTVKENDAFYIEINENGVADNSNGIQLGLLQQAGIVAGNSSNNTITLTEDYADLTSRLGAAVMSANNDLTAASAKCEQTQALYQSSAGVNLDEEAANLVRFQQSYTSCAKIITASQTIFDALINAF